MSRRIFRCSHTDTAPSAAGAKTDDEDVVASIFSSDSASEDAQPSTKLSLKWKVHLDISLIV